MLSKHFYKLAILLFAVLLYFLTADYIFHKIAFDSGQIIEAEIIDKDCRRKGGSNIDISCNGTTSFVEVLGGGCSDLIIGQKIKVLYSKFNDKYYWNTEPLSRVLWFAYPFILGLIVYLFILDRRLNRKTNDND